MGRGHDSLLRVRAVTAKEMLHIRRDPQTLVIVLVLPLVVMFIFGYAFDADMKELPVAIEVPVPSDRTSEVVAALDATTLFDVKLVARVLPDPEDLFRRQRVKAVFRLGASFTRDLGTEGVPAVVQVLIDGSDPNTGIIVRGAAQQALLQVVRAHKSSARQPIVVVKKRVLYNPQQRSAFFFVPGLVAIVLIMISALLTSITITRERELGTMAQLLISPLHPWEIIAGKIVPYIGLAAADGILIMAVGSLVFSVPIRGSVLLLCAGALVYIFTSLAIGILISTLTTRQQHAMLIALVSSVMPVIVLSGFVFPVASMPLPLRMLANIIPAKHFLVFIRSVVLKGVGLQAVWMPIAVILVEGIAMVAISVKKFKVTS